MAKPSGTRPKLNTLLTSQPVLVLTGAGASKALGKATTYDLYESPEFQGRKELRLLTELRELLRKKHVDDPVDLEFLLDEIQRLNNNFDELKDIPQYQGHLGKVQGERDRFGEVYEHCLDFLVDYYGSIDEEHAARLYEPLFHGLLHMVGASRSNTVLNPVVSMFTLNYDEAVERAGNNMPMYQVVDGFRASHPPRWERRVFDDLRKPRNGAIVALFKLHGSVSWTRSSGSEVIETTIGVPRRRLGRDHAILYPTQRTKPNDLEPFATAYEYFVEALARSRLAVCIGTSFRDMELRELIRKRVGRSKPFSILAVGPDANKRELADRLEIPQKHIFTKTYGFEESTVPKILAHIADLLDPVAE